MKFSYNWYMRFSQYQKIGGYPTPSEFEKKLDSLGYTIEKKTYLSANDYDITKDDISYDISVPRNRRDLMNMSWVSKEMCGVYHKFFREFAGYWTDGGNKKQYKDPLLPASLNVIIKTKKCSLLVGNIVNYVDFNKPEQLEEKVKDRLIGCGFELKNPLENSLNYFMRFNGQPIYLFDLNKLKSKNIVALDADKNGEIVSNGIVYKYDKGDSILCCEDDVLVVRGILVNDEFTATLDTHAVVILSAVFDRDDARQAALKYDISDFRSVLVTTGAIPQTAVGAPSGMASMLYSMCDASGIEEIDLYNKCDMTRTFLTYTADEINEMLDTDFTYEEIKDTFENPECPTNAIGDGRINTMLPSYRMDKTVNDIAQSLLVYWGTDRIGRRQHED